MTYYHNAFNIILMPFKLWCLTENFNILQLTVLNVLEQRYQVSHCFPQNFDINRIGLSQLDHTSYCMYPNFLLQRDCSSPIQLVAICSAQFWHQNSFNSDYWQNSIEPIPKILGKAHYHELKYLIIYVQIQKWVKRPSQNV